MSPYKHYITVSRIDGKDIIVDSFSTANREPEEGDILVYEGNIRQCYIMTTSYGEYVNEYKNGEVKALVKTAPVAQTEAEVADILRLRAYREYTDPLALEILLTTIQQYERIPTAEELAVVYTKKDEIKLKYPK